MMMMMKMKIVTLIFPGRSLHLGQMILAVGSPSSGTKRKDRRIVAFKAFNGTAVTDSMAHRLTIPMEGKALAPTRVTLRSIIVSGMSCNQMMYFDVLNK